MAYIYIYICPFFNLYAYLTLHKRYSLVTVIVLLYFILSAISTRHVSYTKACHSSLFPSCYVTGPKFCRTVEKILLRLYFSYKRSLMGIQHSFYGYVYLEAFHTNMCMKHCA